MIGRPLSTDTHTITVADDNEKDILVDQYAERHDELSSSIGGTENHQQSQTLNPDRRDNVSSQLPSQSSPLHSSNSFTLQESTALTELRAQNPRVPSSQEHHCTLLKNPRTQDPSPEKNHTLHDSQAPPPPTYLRIEEGALESSSVFNDSLDSSDINFSQDLQTRPESVSSRDEDTMSDIEDVITEDEVRSLSTSTYLLHLMSSECDAGGNLCEDICSRLFHDFDDERFNGVEWNANSEEECPSVGCAITEGELAARAQSQQNGGLSTWNYDSPLTDVQVKIDDVNEILEKRFLYEANAVLDNIISDIASKELSSGCEGVEAPYLTPLACVQTFITDCLLERMKCFANRVLHQKRKEPTTTNELLGIIILHILCASYNESPTIVCHDSESENFFQMGIDADRYHDVWAALGGSKDKRAVHDYSSTGWCRSANRTTSVITDVEAEIAAINRELLYIPNATILSLDDDHLRMASRSVNVLTYLQQHNNPKKGLGPVGNALCSALNPFFIACHFTRTGEKLLHTWERLAQLLQGASTNGALRPMPEAIFAADRGYNSKETIEFVSNVLGASLIGTHKRDLWYPFVFGDGPISKRHKGMNISEKGCRAVYTARLKSTASGTGRSHGRNVEACMYRESCSGRIAALIHNNTSLFPSRCFTVVLKEAFRSQSSSTKLQDALTVYDESLSENSRGMRERYSDIFAQSVSTNGKQAVAQVLNRVTQLTYYQSEDPTWFLLRAFRFTSRTAHGFVAAVARDYGLRIKGMAVLLAGKRLTAISTVMPQNVIDTEQCIKDRWDSVLEVLGVRKRSSPRPSSRRSLAQQISGYSQSRLNSFTKNDLHGMLRSFEREVDTRATKAELVSSVLLLKQDISNNAVDLDNESSLLSEEDVFNNASNNVCDSFREASLTAWVMKPLVTTAGMREGSRNEIEILKGLQPFFSSQKGAYRRTAGTSNYCVDETCFYVVKYVRSVGLVESKSCELLADSPDAVVAVMDENEDITVYAVEIKTMTAVRTIGDASELSAKYGKFIILSNVGVDVRSTELFQELIPTSQYRAQVLHHAATLCVNSVMFVVGTGGTMTEGRILYACAVNFAESFRHNYTYVIDCVHYSAFRWIGGDAKFVPEEYDGMLKYSHASDIHSFMSYYNLSQALRRAVRERGAPLPPSRMIRLTPTVFWNHLKGGVDVISRHMKTIARCNISENPVVSILGRLFSMQISNAAVAYRLYQARKQKVLPRYEEVSGDEQRGYVYLRHRLSQCETLGRFARVLAKEWVELRKIVGEVRQDTLSNNHPKISPMFTRNAAERYNLGTHKARRLNNRIEHTKVVGQATYCVLCSWTLRGSKAGKAKIRRKGSRQVQWCGTCKQAICTSCWSEWHTKPTLKRAKPTQTDVRLFEQSLRYTRRRFA